MRRIRLLGLAGLLAVVAGVPSLASAGTATAAPSAPLPSSMHGSVETQAFTAGTGAVSLFFDPGPAYAYAVLDYTRLEDKPEVSMTSRGATANLGATALAVIWAPPGGSFPNCDPNNGTAPCVLSPVGLHEAGGFAGYSEAIYPVFPGGHDRRHVKKCILNKDADGGVPTGGALQAACASDSVPGYSSADSDVADGVPYAHGFTRLAGGGSPGMSIGSSVSNAEVRPDDQGRLVSTGSSEVTGVDLAGVVQIHAVRTEATIVARADQSRAEQASASCTFSGLTIAGQAVPFDPVHGIDQSALQPAIAAAKGLGYAVSVVPPAPALAGTTPEGKHIASCTGLKVSIDDLNPQSRLSSRLDYTFGFINISEAVNDVSLGLPAAVGSVGAAESAAATTVDNAVSGAAPASAASDVGAAATPEPSTSGASPTLTPPLNRSYAPSSAFRAGTGGGAGAVALGRTQAVRKVGPNVTAVGGLAAATAVLIGAGVWLLIGVVLSLATGKSLRFPGARLP